MLCRCSVDFSKGFVFSLDCWGFEVPSWVLRVLSVLSYHWSERTFRGPWFDGFTLWKMFYTTRNRGKSGTWQPSSFYTNGWSSSVGWTGPTCWIILAVARKQFKRTFSMLADCSVSFLRIYVILPVTMISTWVRQMFGLDQTKRLL